jgi:hypothetical protein
LQPKKSLATLLIAIGATSGIIEWEKVPAVFGYTTKIIDSAGSVFDSIRSHHINKFEFAGLDPYQHYIIEVTAKYGEKTLVSQIPILTDPNPPEINERLVGPTYISIWWPSVPGTLGRFTIFIDFFVDYIFPIFCYTKIA